MGSKKKTTQKVNQTQTAAPPTWTMPGLSYAGNLVTEMLKQNAPGTPYQGDFVAAPDADRTAEQIALLEGAADKVGGLGGFVDEQMRSLYAARDGTALLNDAIKAAMNPAFEQLQEEILPGITNSALLSGAYTNDRALGVVPGQAIAEATESAQRIGAELAYEGFQADENRRVQKAGLLPSLANLVGQMYTAPADILGAASNLDVALRQGNINNDLAKHEYGVRAPYERIAPAAELLALLSQNWGTQTLNGETVTTQKTGGLGQVLSGALGVASMLGSLGAFGPIGAAAGAGAGAAGAASGGGVSSLFRNPFGGGN